ncbi:MAG: hydroxymethylbilane synthase [Deltaproteobacteria bacterium]
MSQRPPRPIRIATRASRLALWQADHVAGLLRSASPGIAVEIVHVSTTGDRDQTGRLSAFGGLGVFTREVQKAVLDGTADVAVHSLKDLPTESAAGLVLAAVPEREQTADALVLPASAAKVADLAELPRGARLGTGSLRRRAQLLHQRPDFQMSDVRGNVETRLRKLDAGDFDALVMAVAGLKRLGLAGRIALELAPPLMYPAVGQGALGIECRQADAETIALLSKIDDPAARSQVTAERALLARLRAGCHAPVGAVARVEAERLLLAAVVLSPDGKEWVFAEGTGRSAHAASLGQLVADRLLQQGAERLIVSS